MSDDHTPTGPVVINASDLPAITAALKGERPPSRLQMKRKARDKEATKRYMRGENLQSIADDLGYSSRGHVSQRIRAYTENRDADTAETFRSAELSRLAEATDFIMSVVGGTMDISYEDMDDGMGRVAKMLADHTELRMKAVDRLVKLGERQGKVLGYDAPTKVENSGTGTVIVEFPASMNVGGMADSEVTVEPRK